MPHGIGGQSPQYSMPVHITTVCHCPVFLYEYYYVVAGGEAGAVTVVLYSKGFVVGPTYVDVVSSLSCACGACLMQPCSVVRCPSRLYQNRVGPRSPTHASSRALCAWIRCWRYESSGERTVRQTFCSWLRLKLQEESFGFVRVVVSYHLRFAVEIFILRRCISCTNLHERLYLLYSFPFYADMGMQRVYPPVVSLVSLFLC